MKKLFVWMPAFLLMIALLSCNKDKSCGFTDSAKTAPESEQNAIQDSLTKYNIAANLAPAGFYYKIVDPGTGGIVSNLCSKVNASYWGGFFNGKGFDSSATPVPFVLGQTIVGWQKAIPLVKEGGEIHIYIPPSLAYADKRVTDRNGNTLIPPNSYLVFRVKVKTIE